LLSRGALSKDLELWVWIDIASIPQSHRGLMQMAVGSLPAYASQADVFLILAPEATHSTTSERCGLGSYERRGWCRAEVFAKVCGSGLKGIFIAMTAQPAAGADSEAAASAEAAAEVAASAVALRALAETDLDTFSVFVFEGEFSELADRQNLVKPILGLYALTLRSSNQWLVSIRLFIHANKERFFPKDEHRADGFKQPLFAEYVSILERKLRQTRAGDGARQALSRCTLSAHAPGTAGRLREEGQALLREPFSQAAGKGSRRRSLRASFEKLWRPGPEQEDESGVRVEPGFKLGAIAALVATAAKTEAAERSECLLRDAADGQGL
jgi:hypothetical protein